MTQEKGLLDITVNFMLNKRKSKKAAGASPLTPLGELSALPQTPPVPSPVVNIFISPQNPGSAPESVVGRATTSGKVLCAMVHVV